MIPQIQEIGFGPGTQNNYATLSQATISLADMGDRTVTTQVKIDGSVVPDFTGWELRLRGERFILPTRVPQAAKGNDSINSLIDLTFESWVIHELKRYFYVQTATISSGTVIADQYEASMNLPLVSFVENFNSVLQYYFGSKVAMILAPPPSGGYSNEPVLVEINKTYIWDVLTKFYEMYGLRWRIHYDSALDQYQILVGYEDISIDDHDFEYGYNGGLLRFERQVQDYDITNVLLGRGGEKNIPYRYFKRVDPQNPNWAADPDAIPELQNIYFDRLRDANFRSYIQGWRTNPRRDTSWEVVQAYDAARGATDWAYEKGHTDTQFNPVEYVKDDDSIAKYGEHWGALDDDDEIFPTIQGIGDIDEVVDVSEIVSDDIEAAAEYEETAVNIIGTRTVTHNFGIDTEYTDVLTLGPITVPEGQVGDVSWTWMAPSTLQMEPVPTIVLDTAVGNIMAVNVDTGTEVGPTGLLPGTYEIKVTLTARNSSGGCNYITYGLNTLKLTLSAADENAWKPTFDIWVKNIWNTQKGATESPEEYAERVWADILGDRTGNEAKVVFSTGFMSVSEDYEFTIAAFPVFDQSKVINEVPSEWRITLYKSDADLDVTGLYVPSASGGKPQAGDRFFFIGIDMPHLYVTEAEKRVRTAKEAALQDTAETSPTWVITMDKVRVHTEEDADEYGLLADRLDAGVKLRITDPRFTDGAVLSLYVQSITYTWNEPSDGSPYVVPDIEVVLSDDVVAVEGAVKRIQNDLQIIKTRYVQAYEVEEMVRRVTSPMYLKKGGEPDTSLSPSTFKSIVKSDNFREGNIGGSGWGFYKDGQGRSILEADKIIVRQDMEVNSLVANQITYIGGKQIISAASIECTQVEDSQDFYTCYFDQKRGSVANLFKEGDIVMGQSFSPENKEVRYYRYVIDSIGDNYIALEKDGGVGGAPVAGDTIVQYGHITDPDRQFVIIRDIIGGGYERMLSDLDSVDSDGKEYYFAGMTKEGTEEFVALQDKNDALLYDKNNALLGYAKYTAKHRWFVGDKDAEYAEWVDGALTVKGRIIVRNSSGQYKQMEGYLDTIDYLQEALPEDEENITTIAGGIVLSKIIGVESNGDLVAGLNASILGKDSTHGTLMIFAGAQDAEHVSDAKFKVYEDGTIYASKLSAEAGCYLGSFYLESATPIGGMTVMTSHYESPTYPYRDNIHIWPNQISIGSTNTDSNNEMGRILMGWGRNTPYISDWALLTITNSRDISDASRAATNKGIQVAVSGTGMDHRGIDVEATGNSTLNYAIYAKATGTSSTNYAVFAEQGMYGGLRLPVISRSTSNFTLNLGRTEGTNVILVDASGGTINLPSNPQHGQVYYIFIGYSGSSTYYQTTINGGTHYIKRTDSATVATSTQHTTHRGLDFLVYNESESYGGVSGVWHLAVTAL